MKTRSFVRPLAALAFLTALAGSAFAGDVASTTTANHRRSEQAPSASAAMKTSAATSAMPAAQKSAAKSAPKVDLNSATREQLMALPGIGDAIADKIIAARPFKMKSDLLSKGLVNKAQYAKLAPHVIAKQS